MVCMSSTVFLSFMYSMSLITMVFWLRRHKGLERALEAKLPPE